MEELRKLLRQARAAKRWSRNRLAEEASKHSPRDITEDEIFGLEVSRQKPPPHDLLEPVCLALGVKMATALAALYPPSEGAVA